MGARPQRLVTLVFKIPIFVPCVTVTPASAVTALVITNVHSGVAITTSLIALKLIVIVMKKRAPFLF